MLGGPCGATARGDVLLPDQQSVQCFAADEKHRFLIIKVELLRRPQRWRLPPHDGPCRAARMRRDQQNRRRCTNFVFRIACRCWQSSSISAFLFPGVHRVREYGCDVVCHALIRGISGRFPVRRAW
ncbi:hypothetical protein DID96_36010 [Burkholderia sp. Bp8963]|nr:hypothetical protein DID96_36010 [Burkholderia sp. Bp8963]